MRLVEALQRLRKPETLVERAGYFPCGLCGCSRPLGALVERAARHGMEQLTCIDEDWCMKMRLEKAEAEERAGLGLK